MSDVSIALGGFGSQGWGTAAWGEGNVSFVATGEIEGPAIDAGSEFGVTSVNGTGEVGTVLVFTDVGVLVTGVAGTVSIGSVAVNGTANIALAPLLLYVIQACFIHLLQLAYDRIQYEVFRGTLA